MGGALDSPPTPSRPRRPPGTDAAGPRRRRRRRGTWTGPAAPGAASIVRRRPRPAPADRDGARQRASEQRQGAGLGDRDCVTLVQITEGDPTFGLGLQADILLDEEGRVAIGILLYQATA